MRETAALAYLILWQAAAFLLVISGRRHGRNRLLLDHHLRAHRVLPRRTVAVVGRVLPPVSTSVGAAAVAVPLVVALALPGAWPTAARLAAGTTTVVYAAFLVYLLALRRRSPGTPCACLGGPGERTEHSIVRALAVSAVGLPAVAADVTTALTTVDHWPALHVMATAVAAATAAVAALAGSDATTTDHPIRAEESRT